MKSRLEENGIDRYSTYNEEESVNSEKFIRSLKK